ncbi:MAG: S8 family serine peptidase [Flavobacteriales bacterium]|nr:S8 family serine peptidase [Flavobacteriales bacterium]
MKKQLLFLLLFSLSFVAKPQDYISIKSGKIDYTKNFQLDISQENNYCFLVFNELPTEPQKEIIEQLGIRFLEYLPRNTFVVNMPQNFNPILLDPFGVINLFNVHPDNKLDPKIQNGVYPDWALKEDRLSIKVLFYRDVDFNLLDNILGSFDYQLDYTRTISKSISITINTSNLEDFININEVWYIEPIDPPSVAENKTARTLHRSNAINTNYASGAHYNGEGINIMMQDDGLVGPHIDRQGRLDQSFCIGCSSNINNDHGDHVSGTIMGAGNLDPIAKGMADGSFLYVFSSSNNNYDDVPTIYQNNDVIITSKSYSNGCNAGYTSLAKDLDEQINLYPSLTHVFSAGNNGTSDCGYGAGSGWGNVTGGHKQAKNVICVANLTQISNLAGSSSRGPAADGRIKPDVGAKGTSVNSTLPGNTYDSFTGTSMACPGVAGCMAQLYQAYKELNGNINPPSALMKCIVLNSADDLGNPGPDFKYGWGEINVMRGLNILEEGNYQSGAISQASSNNHDIIIPNGIKEMKIMVYWHDKEASTSSTIALVNNLDIQLATPLGNTISPWVLDPTPNSLLLDSDAVRGIDSLNNMEQITIKDPVPGIYNLLVNGTSVPFGPQEYWLTYELFSDDIQLTYPIGGEGLVPGEYEIIRWDAPEDNTPFMLEYTLDDGISWTTITTATSVNANYYHWSIPSLINGLPYATNQARIRISRNGVVDESDTNFTIIDVPDVTVDWICPDSIYVIWDTVAGATAYEVSMLGQKYMDSITTVFANGNPTQSALIINPNPLILDSWFSVSAKYNGNNGRRDIAINAQPINSSCMAPPIASFIVSDSISCSGTVIFEDDSYGQPNSWNWDFGDGNSSSLQNPTHLYTLEGTYDVSLHVSNSLGQDSIILMSVVLVDFSDPPITFNDTSYISPSTFTLTSTGNSVDWYSDTLGSSSIATGQIFTTPLLFNNTTFYARENGGPIIIGGPIDNNIGGGNFYNNDRHIYIDCFKDSRLVSADVYAGTSHNITFELRDNNSQVIEDTTILVQTGLNVLELNFEIPVMNDLELGVGGSGAYLFRNTSGATYPYLIGNLANITGHNSPYPGDTNYHYFFYNLKIQETCLSNYAPAQAVFVLPSNLDNEENYGVNIYPNPVSDQVFIVSEEDIEQIKIYDVSGRLCFVNSDAKRDILIDVSEFAHGIYTINIISNIKSYVSKLVVE